MKQENAERAHHHDDRQPARIVVWAHNSHVGDARATEVSAEGELTLGQLAREKYGDEARLLGFSTYRGTVTAASEWGGIAERKATSLEKVLGRAVKRNEAAPKLVEYFGEVFGREPRHTTREELFAALERFETQQQAVAVAAPA